MDPGKVKTMPFTDARERGLITDIDPRESYFGHLRKLLDTEALRQAGLKVAVDVLYGTGMKGCGLGTLNGFLQCVIGCPLG